MCSFHAVFHVLVELQLLVGGPPSCYDFADGFAQSEYCEQDEPHGWTQYCDVRYYVRIFVTLYHNASAALGSGIFY